jgi:hypothetical protein
MKYNEKKRLQLGLRRLYTGEAPSKELLNLKNNPKLNNEMVNKLITECEQHNDKIYAKYLV